MKPGVYSIKYVLGYHLQNERGSASDRGGPKGPSLPRPITLVGGDGTALASKPGSQPDTIEVSLPAAGSIQMTSTDAWVLKIAKRSTQISGPP